MSACSDCKIASDGVCYPHEVERLKARVLELEAWIRRLDPLHDETLRADYAEERLAEVTAALKAATDSMQSANVTIAARPNKETVFLVTVMKPIDREGVPDKHLRRDRTWGWYSNFEAAERAVLANVTDMFECNYYNYAVIEEVPEGILTLAKVRGWYFADYAETEGPAEPVVTKIDAPVWAKRIVNWGIG